MESRKRRNESERDGREHRTRKRDGCQNGEHVEKEWKRGRINSNTIRSSREDIKRGTVRETEERRKTRRRKKQRNKKHYKNKD